VDRRDIVVPDDDGKRIVIVDVAVPFEIGTAAFDEARGEKVRKFHSMTEDLRGADYVIEVEVFLVGALDSWDTRKEWAMSPLGGNLHYATWMRLMVSEMYVEHFRGCAHRWGRGTRTHKCKCTLTRDSE
jgi:hypothetical protein